ncbi:MAG: ABC transporter ATP-binding protein [Polyangiaceae bacterium]|nr:ABC transporter ATP-binding protein [Polyangiaceae bacterium]
MIASPVASNPVPSDAPAVRCARLTKRFDKQTAVAGISLEVRVGECLGLLGPNGAGKTTTVEMLEGLYRPDGGTIELFGQSWSQGHDQRLRERLGVGLQDTQLADKLTVLEVLRLFRSFYRGGRTVDELVALVGLKDERNKRYHLLSGGQKQRLALACALVGAPDLLFLDEPTTGLDPRARKNVWSVVEQFRARGGTVLLTTHYMEEAAALCDKIAVMDQGRIIAEGTPRGLVDGLGMVQFVEFETPCELDQATLEQAASVTCFERRGDRYRLCLDRSLAALRRLLAELERQQVTPIGLSTHQATLDDVFLTLTGRALHSDLPDRTGQLQQAPVEAMRR